MNASAPVAEPVAAFLVWLKERHARIMDFEQRALSALNNEQEELYRSLMRDKADAIAVLDSDALPLVEALPGDIKDDAETSLRRFAKGAGNALRINSVFYMSALLYPDEHTPGEPDNLLQLIARVSEYQETTS